MLIKDLRVYQATVTLLSSPQAVPIPPDKADEVQETMVGCALSQNIELHEIPTHSEISQVCFVFRFRKNYDI